MARAERPSLDELLTLVMVADKETQQAAAKALGIKQPVVSRRLQVFRKSPALVRLHKGRVELTDKGREALPAIRRLLRQHEHLKHYLTGQREQGSLLTIGVGSSASQFYLARALVDLRRRLPGWEILTRVQRGKDRIAGVVEGALDVALVTHSRLQIENLARWACDSRTGLQIDDLAGLPLCVFARRDTPEGGQLQSVLAGQVVPVKLLAGLPLAGLDRESGLRLQLEAWLHGQGQGLAFTMEAGGWLGVKEFVRQGLCAGLIPLALLSPEEAQQFVVRRLPKEFMVTYRIIARPDADAELLAPVRDALHQAAGEFQEEVERRWSGLL
jgi:DNA-binding transcriptional LysR family regulator